jgi:valyl-tRNA synthetase
LRDSDGLTRQQLGREAFEQRVWQWKDDYSARILAQLRRTGASLDWTREFFSLDAIRSNAVDEAFLQLFNDGLMYRAERLVHWCVKLQTAISDIEVDQIEVGGRRTIAGATFGVMWDIAYPLVDNNNNNNNNNDDVKELIVSTTRPETMFADVALAVHPDDHRYNSLIGGFVRHPLTDRLLPIVGDSELVNREVGSGVVKVTPAHDANDYACGLRHGLKIEKYVLLLLFCCYCGCC